MRTSLGISAGAEVVCSALVVTAANGAQSFDYRVVSADAHSDLGDLVSSSIEMMTTQLPNTPAHEVVHPVGSRFAGVPRDLAPVDVHPPTSVAVAYRTKEQAQIIRATTGKQREVRLIPEGLAALTFLRHTGLIDRYDTVAIVDFGASGLTVTVADQADEALLRSERTGVVSGKAIDNLVYRHLVDLHFARRGTRPNRHTLTNRGRAAKEHLSIATAVTMDHVAGRPLKLTRADFEELITDLLREMARFVMAAVSRAPKPPQAVALIGGGANIPAVLNTLTAALDLPVFTVPEPETVTAKGAALVADSAQPSPSAHGAGGDAPSGTVAKVIGTLAGAIVVVGLIVGYGVRTFAPVSDDEVSPAGTTSTAVQLPPPPGTVTPPPGSSVAGRHESAVPTIGGVAPPTTADREPRTSTFAPSTAPATTPTQPTLRPDPNLPPIPFPELLGPLLGNSGLPQALSGDRENNEAVSPTLSATDRAHSARTRLLPTHAAYGSARNAPATERNPGRPL